MALRNDGTVWAWGHNDSGQLGDGSYTDSHFPVQVSGLTGITAIKAGAGHVLALKSDGTVWAWGASGVTDSPIPEQIRSPDGNGILTGIVAIAAGYSHDMAVKGDGSVWAWGRNDYGQLGDGSFITRPYPVRVIGLKKATTVSVGYWHSLAIEGAAK